MKKMTHIAVAVVSMTLAHAALAAVSADEAKHLGGDKLTLFGAEKAGNKDGTIPAYSGKAPRAPASFNKTEPGQRPDPYNDKPLFSITAQNAEKYADKLDGMLEMFKKYPNYRMDVYPSRRDFAYPKFVLDNTVKNAASCKGANDELKLEGCYGGFPFPIPKTGRQAMWNHLIQYAAVAVKGTSDAYVTPTNGKAILQARSESIQQYDIFNPAATLPNPSDALYWQIYVEDNAPARKAGGKLVFQDSMDTVNVGRRVYQYIPGQRRVKLAPNLAYDTPSPQSGGSATMDDMRGFMGALDRFDFKLIGKKEKYILNNNYSLANYKACPAEKLVNNPFFPHPDCMRWELQRVWKVEATLKPEFRHVYSKRTFYWYEDVPGAGGAEDFDASGKLYRVVNISVIPFYEGEGAGGGGGGFADIFFNHDLQTGLWQVQSVSSFPGGGFYPIERQDPRLFTPDALSGAGVR